MSSVPTSRVLTRLHNPKSNFIIKTYIPAQYQTRFLVEIFSVNFLVIVVLLNKAYLPTLVLILVLVTRVLGKEIASAVDGGICMAALAISFPWACVLIISLVGF